MRKRFRNYGIGGAFIVAIAAALWFGFSDHMSLLDRSTRITSVRGWGMEQPNIAGLLDLGLLTADRSQYQWIGNRQILFFHDLKSVQATIFPPGGTSTRARVVLNRPASPATPTLYDVATHREQALPKLAELFHLNNNNVHKALVSIDSTRLCWHDNQSQFHIAMLDGSQHAQFVNRTDVGAGWPQDSTQLYTYGWARSTNKHVKGVPKIDTIAVNLWDRNNGKSLGRRLFVAPTNYDAIGDCTLLSNGGLAANSLEQGHTSLTLYRIPPALNSGTHSVTPALPSDAMVEALVYSPQGDRLAWIIDRDVPSPFAFLSHWFPRYAPASRRTTSLWVSGTLGENLHEIGHLSFQPRRQQFCLLDYVRWQPDEKTLSFVSKDFLYTVPAD